MGPVPMGLDLLKISNQYCGKTEPFRVLKLLLGTDIGLI